MATDVNTGRKIFRVVTHTANEFWIIRYKQNIRQHSSSVTQTFIPSDSRVGKLIITYVSFTFL